MFTIAHISVLADGNSNGIGGFPW